MGVRVPPGVDQQAANAERPTSNTQFRTRTKRIGCWTLSVGCWTFRTLDDHESQKLLQRSESGAAEMFLAWDPKEKGFRRYKELSDSTVVVVIAMLLLGGYVALFDFVLVNVVHFFTRIH